MIRAADGSHDSFLDRDISVRIVSCWRFGGRGVKSCKGFRGIGPGGNVYPEESNISM